MTVVENAMIDIDNTGQERYTLNEEQFGLLIDNLVKNITVTPCCTELKEDKKKPTFEEWVYMNNYTPKSKQYFDENSIMWTEHELIKMYNDEVMSL